MGDAARAFRQVRLSLRRHPGAEAQSGSAVGPRRAFRERSRGRHCGRRVGRQLRCLEGPQRPGAEAKSGVSAAAADGRLSGRPRGRRRPRRAARKRCGTVLGALESSQLFLRRPTHPFVRADQQSFGPTGRAGCRRALCSRRRQAGFRGGSRSRCGARRTPVPDSVLRVGPTRKTPSASRTSPIALKPRSARRSSAAAAVAEARSRFDTETQNRFPVALSVAKDLIVALRMTSGKRLRAILHDRNLLRCPDPEVRVI